jgi:glucan 1,3-beta-glucosidase
MLFLSPCNSYYQAYNLVRTASGTGAGNGPFISYHDGFFSRSEWAGFLTGADRISLDTHPYLCFDGQSSAPMSSYATTPCSTWGAVVNASMGAFGLSTNGEFSNAVTDCGLYVNGIGMGARYDGTYIDGTWPVVGQCSTWTDWQNYDQNTKQAIQNFALASMDALQVRYSRSC